MYYWFVTVHLRGLLAVTYSRSMTLKGGIRSFTARHRSVRLEELFDRYLALTLYCTDV
jgi:hypothetical protein